MNKEKSLQAHEIDVFIPFQVSIVNMLGFLFGAMFFFFEKKPGVTVGLEEYLNKWK